MLGFYFHNLDLFPHLFPRFGFATPFFRVCTAHAARSWPAPDFFGGGMFPTGGRRAVFEIPPPSITCGRKKMGNRSVSGGCGQRFNLPPYPWVKARTGGIGPGRSAPQPLAQSIGHRTGKVRTCKAPCLQGQAGRIDPGTGTGTGRHRTRSRAWHPSPLSISRLCVQS
jgi:hypothetical protein